MTRRVAAFDFDGTIAKRDTLVPFLFRQAPAKAVVASIAGCVRAAPGGTDGFRDRLKAHLCRSLFAGVAAAELERVGLDYAQGLPRLYRPDVLDHITWHRAQGHDLVLVTASLGVYARPAAQALDFGHVIATELEVDASGRLTGALAAPNVRGAEKKRRLLEWLSGSDAGHVTDADHDVELWAYGDSAGDAHMLELADHHRWIGRRASKRHLDTGGA